LDQQKLDSMKESKEMKWIGGEKADNEGKKVESL